jgi:hypothetical protein
MKIERATQNLRKLVGSPAKRRLGHAEAIVIQCRVLIRQAMRRGHSLEAIAVAVNVKPRTLQNHLGKAGLFFRRPRTKKGTVIRPYKARERVGFSDPVPNI